MNSTAPEPTEVPAETVQPTTPDEADQTPAELGDDADIPGDETPDDEPL